MSTYTTEQYNSLVAAIATGATFVKYSDKEVHYRNLPEMQSLRQDMEIDVGITPKPVRRRIGVYRKGLRGV